MSTKGTTAAGSADYSQHYLTLPIPEEVKLKTGVSVGLGESVVVVPSLASSIECSTLLSAATGIVRGLDASDKGTAPHRGELNPGRTRLNIEDYFNEDVKALCDAILIRVLDWVSLKLPELKHGFFGKAVIDRCLGNSRFTFACGEPAINIYTAGGRFECHEDKQSLTILIPLSNPSDFDGGGTAFWGFDPEARAGSASTARAAKREAEIDPAFVLKPDAGSCILFGGTVTHAGQAVVRGERGVFVCSLSLAKTEPDSSSEEDDKEDATTNILREMRSAYEEEEEMWRDACLDCTSSDEEEDHPKASR